ncbi:MAG: GreA/GreB family elongation factor [Flavobacteriales bacterium]|nr:GreA/GreB family elongation factor [Flavobacteriales bacterium]MCB9364573.1 GreA/GreB family elongation factor [Flavobacteriales bacterium]
METTTNTKTIIVTKKEHELFKRLIETSHTVDPIEKKSHRKLYEELKTATIVNEKELPKKVVRLNSIVTIQTSFGRKDGMQLVLPSEGDLSKRKLSIMSPMGSALLGYIEGDKVPWILPMGTEDILIEKVIN